MKKIIFYLFCLSFLSCSKKEDIEPASTFPAIEAKIGEKTAIFSNITPISGVNLLIDKIAWEDKSVAYQCGIQENFESVMFNFIVAASQQNKENFNNFFQKGKKKKFDQWTSLEHYRFNRNDSTDYFFYATQWGNQSNSYYEILDVKAENNPYFELSYLVKIRFVCSLYDKKGVFQHQMSGVIYSRVFYKYLKVLGSQGG